MLHIFSKLGICILNIDSVLLYKAIKKLNWQKKGKSKCLDWLNSQTCRAKQSKI